VKAKTPFAVAALVVMLGVSAGAKVGTGNSWTQLENGNYPQDSKDPHCETAPRVCIRWSTNGSRGYFEGYWHYDVHQPESYWKTDAISAVGEWGGQPYRSPVFTHTPNACGLSATHVCISEQDLLNPAYCGDGPSNHYNSGIIYHGWVRLNTPGAHFYDDRKPKPTGGNCALHTVLLHELGHDWSEGHSAVPSALMSVNGGGAEDVDAYAQGELKAVYGQLAYSGNTGGGCSYTSETSVAYCPSGALEYKAKLLEEAKAMWNFASS